MSQIDELKKKHEKEQKEKRVTVADIERFVANKIVNILKRDVESAIRNNKVSCSYYCFYQEGILHRYTFEETRTTMYDYLNDSWMGLLHLPYLFPSKGTTIVGEEDATDIMVSAMWDREKLISLQNILSIVKSELYDFGVKQMEIHLEYRDYYYHKVPGWFKEKTVKETIKPILKFCYKLEW